LGFYCSWEQKLCQAKQPRRISCVVTTAADKSGEVADKQNTHEKRPMSGQISFVEYRSGERKN